MKIILIWAVSLILGYISGITISLWIRYKDWKKYGQHSTLKEFLARRKDLIVENCVVSGILLTIVIYNLLIMLFVIPGGVQ